MTADVSLQSITMRFGDFTALDDLNLDIPKGDYTVLLGPSGCGKSTLLSILGGFLHPTQGHVLIGGRNVTNMPAAKRPTTTMFQDYALFPHLTLIDNVAFGLRMQGIGKRERRGRAQDLLALVGLPDAGTKRPHELSGGQRQRVALARALAVEPDVLLLDEPLGALDLKLRRAMQDELKAIQTRVGTTFVHVTHDQEEAMAIADTIVVMNAGRIEDKGTPSRCYLHPSSIFTAKFMGEINILTATAKVSDEQSLIVDSPIGPLSLPPRPALRTGDRMTLCLRPELFRTGDAAANRLAIGAATVRDAVFFGTHCRAHVTLGQAELVVHLPQTTAAAAGDTIPLSLIPEQVVVLPPENYEVRD